MMKSSQIIEAEDRQEFCGEMCLLIVKMLISLTWFIVNYYRDNG